MTSRPCAKWGIFWMATVSSPAGNHSPPAANLHGDEPQRPCRRNLPSVSAPGGHQMDGALLEGAVFTRTGRPADLSPARSAAYGRSRPVAHAQRPSAVSELSDLRGHFHPSFSQLYRLEGNFAGQARSPRRQEHAREDEVVRFIAPTKAEIALMEPFSGLFRHAFTSPKRSTRSSRLAGRS